MSSELIESELRNIEHALHAALVRQLRVISLMALLLGVAGFFVGHFVADEQARQSVTPLEAQLHDLQRQLADVTARSARQEALHQQTVAALHRLESQRREEAERDAATLHALLNDIDRRRAASLQELEAYAARRSMVPPQVVAAAINRFVDEHVLQVDRALATAERRLEATAVAAIRGPAQASSLPGTLADRSGAENRAVRQSAAAERALANRPAAYFDPPPRHGLLFLTPTRSGRPDPVRISESEPIPLPPR